MKEKTDQPQAAALEPNYRVELSEWQALFAWATFFVAFGTTDVSTVDT